MTPHFSEQETREKVKSLRKFYSHLTIYGFVNFASLLIWLISGGGYFWPIWIFVGWGIGLTLEATSLGLLPLLAEVFPFLRPEWEEEKIKQMLDSGKEGLQNSSTHSSRPASKATLKETPEKVISSRKTKPLENKTEQ